MNRAWKAVMSAAIGLALVAGLAEARPVDPRQMKNACENWLYRIVQQTGGWAGSVSPAVTGSDDLVVDGVVVARVFRVAPQGYVIVSAAWEMAPVYAYSDETDLGPGRTTDYSPLLRQILGLRHSALVTSPDKAADPEIADLLARNRADWETLVIPPREFAAMEKSTPSLVSGGPLLTSRWNQIPSFTEECPVVCSDGTRAQAGCTMIATGQIMRYYQWPPHGCGASSYCWLGDVSSCGSVEGRTLFRDYRDSYDWAAMPDRCNADCPPESRAAVSELIYEIGVAFNAYWGASGTGAGFHADIFERHFAYEPDVRHHEREDYSQDRWFDIIRSEIQALRPMYYSFCFGTNCNEAHAVVCDGYRFDPLGQTPYWHHINYGWGDGLTGWFLLDHIPNGVPQTDKLEANIRPKQMVHEMLSGPVCAGTAEDIVADLYLPGTLILDSLAVIYQVREAGNPGWSRAVRARMSPVAGTSRTFHALLPTHDPGDSVAYYITAASRPPCPGPRPCDIVRVTEPRGAPDLSRKYRISSEPATFYHDPVRDLHVSHWPPSIQATVSFPTGISSVGVEWQINGAPRADLVLDEIPCTQVPDGFAGAFTDSASIGDVVTYRLRALDRCQPPHASFLPAEGYFEFHVIGQIREDFEAGLPVDWERGPTWCAHDRSYTGSGSGHCALFSYGQGAPGYPEGADESLTTETYSLGANPHLSFAMWTSLTEEVIGGVVSGKSNGSPGRTVARDGGVLETSLDGEEWEPIDAPIVTYDRAIENVPGLGGPFEDGRRVWSGARAWRQVEVDLRPYADTSRRFRFRAGTDGIDDAMYGSKGWAIDDFVLTLNGYVYDKTPADAPENLSTDWLRCVPNPLRTGATVGFALKRAGVTDLEIVDVGGRVVRRLVSSPVAAGVHAVKWDGLTDSGERVASGIYFGRLRQAGFVRKEKLIVVR
jgi:hypothetical protein